MVVRAARLACACALLSCAGPAPRAAEVPRVPLAGPGGQSLDARALAAGAPLTVLTFFSPDCDCLVAHEARLRALAGEYGPRGVRFFMIDSEVGGSLERDAIEAARRGYRSPILLDRGARLADALGARFAAFTVVVDSTGRVRYRGGIDDDRMHLRDDARPYLRDALDDLLGGREPRVAETEALGCALQKW